MRRDSEKSIFQIQIGLSNLFYRNENNMRFKVMDILIVKTTQ